MVKKEEPKPAAAPEGDFKNSLAALIGKGKPTYKKKPEPVVEEPKEQKKVDIFGADDSEDSDEKPS